MSKEILTRNDICRVMVESKILATIGGGTEDDIIGAAKAAIKGGAGIIEISAGTGTGMSALGKVAAICSSNAVIGAGAITNLDQTKEALRKGACFVSAPHFLSGIVSLCHEENRVGICGGLTPSEIASAIDEEADFVNVFPVDLMGGSRYVRQILSVFPMAPIMVSGGIGFASVTDYLESGAKVVAVGMSLIPRALVEAKDFEALTHHVHRFLHTLQHLKAA